MCVIFFYVNANPGPGGYKLILASNRDEYYARATLPAHKWPAEHSVFGGIDMEPGREGGTWLAVAGGKGFIKVGVLLNLTGEPKLPDAHGRGMLSTDYVTSLDPKDNIEGYNRRLLATCHKYTGFNFLSIEIGASKTPARICLCSNTPAALENYEQGQCYGFGNSLPDTPFEKVQKGRLQFEQIVDNLRVQPVERSKLVADLQALLQCRTNYWPDPELKRRAPTLGEKLSALGVQITEAAYGSRTHTIILIDADDCLHYYESTLDGLDPEMDTWQKNYFQQENFSQSI